MQDETIPLEEAESNTASGSEVEENEQVGPAAVKATAAGDAGMQQQSVMDDVSNYFRDNGCRAALQSDGLCEPTGGECPVIHM